LLVTAKPLLVTKSISHIVHRLVFRHPLGATRLNILKKYLGNCLFPQVEIKSSKL